MPFNIIEIAAKALGALCDGASTIDGKGFSRADSSFMKGIIAQPAGDWTLDDTARIYQLLAKYKGQLSALGIDYLSIQAPLFSMAMEDFNYTASEASSNGLPQIVEVRGPADRLSLNGRNWVDEGIESGSLRSTELIAAGEQLKVRYSHPAGGDDPEIVGKESAGHLLSIGIDPTTKEFRASVALHHTTADGLEVAQRIANGEKPAFSFRARVNCTDQENLKGDCAPKPNHPLLLDFLRPNERPGIIGSQVSQVIESHCPGKCGGTCNDCKSVEIKTTSLATEQLNKTKIAGMPSISGGNNNSKGANKNMSYPKNLVLAMIKSPDQAQIMMDAADMMIQADDIEDGQMPGMLDGESQDAYEARCAVEAAKKKMPPAFMKKGAPATPPAAAESFNGQRHGNPPPAAKPKAEPMTDDQAAEAFGMSLEAFKIMKVENEAKARKNLLSSQLATAYESAKSNTGPGKLFGFPVRDDKDKFPATAVESYIAAANENCADYSEAQGFIKAKLSDLSNGKTSAALAVEVATLETKLKGVMAIPGNINRTTQGGSGLAYGIDKSALESVDKIELALLDNIRITNPELYAKYESRKGVEMWKRGAQEVRQNALEQYGARINKYSAAHNGLATEEAIVSSDAAALPNYAKVMTAIMGLRYWTPSPMQEFFGQVVNDAMRIGPMLNNGTGDIGQFVEIKTMVRDQRRVYDAGYYKLPADMQREMGIRHGYHQYFAFQESERWRTDTSVSYFMGLAPNYEDIPVMGLQNLREELDKFDEMRGSTEALRSSDAYNSITLGSPETTNMGVTSHRGYSASGGITTPGGTYIANGIGWVIPRRNQSSVTDPLLTAPLMRPGVRPVMLGSTLTFTDEYPILINAIQGKVQSRGEYNPSTQLGEKINDRDDDPTFLQLPDECIIVFLAGSRYDLSHGPVFTQYTWVDNYDLFDFNNGGVAISKKDLADLFVEFVGSMRSRIAERQVPPELIKFMIVPAAANETVVNFSRYLNGTIQALNYAGVSSNYQSGNGAQASYFRNMKIVGSTEPLYANRLRGMFGTPGLTVVQELGAPEIGPRLPGIVTGINGISGYNDQWSQSITRRMFINTIPRRDPTTGAPLEFGYGSMYLKNAASVVSRLPA
jgi:hypothetical protein